MFPLFFAIVMLIANIDARTFKIPDNLVLLIGLCGFTLNGLTYIQSALLLCALSLGLRCMPRTRMLGMGDVKYLTALGLFIPLELLGNFLLLIGICGGLWGVIYRSRTGRGCFPFAPAISVGFVLLILLAA